MKYNVDIIIPVYNPDKKFEKLICMLLRQTVRPGRVIILNTETESCTCGDIKQTVKKCYRKTASYDENRKSVIDFVIKSVPFAEFNHGGTRDYGTTLSGAEFYLFMTQDAVPTDNYLIERLMKAFEDEQVAAAYARQEAWMNAGKIEKFTRIYNYPPTSMVKSKDDIGELGIKTYFCSDVCAVYRAADYHAAGGFEPDVIFNEDMIMAANLINAGKKVAYQADAKVYHSHNYDLRTTFKRSFDMAVSQADHPEIFKAVSSEREGGRYVKSTLAYLANQRDYCRCVYFIIQCMFKYAGYLKGKMYKKLSKKTILKCTMNKEYWK